MHANTPLCRLCDDRHSALPLSSRLVRSIDPGELTLTLDPISPGTLTLLSVIDYEPPARAVSRRLPAPLQPRRRQPAKTPPPERKRPVVPSPTLRAAVAFADAALRRVLEVIDRRRPITQLYPLLAAGLVDSVLSGHPVAPGKTGRTEAAILQRVRAQAVESDDLPTAVEVFGTYRRGRRVHALACRIERVLGGTGPRWRVVALHIG